MIADKVLKTVLLTIIIMTFAFLTACESRDARAQRLIGETVELIPKFVEFYEGSEDFFDLLLDIQGRLTEYYSDDVTLRAFEMQFFLRLDGDGNYRPFDISLSLPSNRPQYKLGNEEIELIENAIRELGDILNGHTINAIVREDLVIVGTMTIQDQVLLVFVSPALQSWGGGQFHSRSEIFNSDWSFHIETNVRR